MLCEQGRVDQERHRLVDAGPEGGYCGKRRIAASDPTHANGKKTQAGAPEPSAALHATSVTGNPATRTGTTWALNKKATRRLQTSWP